MFDMTIACLLTPHVGENHFVSNVLSFEGILSWTVTLIFVIFSVYQKQPTEKSHLSVTEY